MESRFKAPTFNEEKEYRFYCKVYEALLEELGEDPSESEIENRINLLRGWQNDEEE